MKTEQGAEEIMKSKLNYLDIIKRITDSRYTILPNNDYVKTGTRIMYDNMYSLILKAMHEFAEQRVREELIKYTNECWSSDRNMTLEVVRDYLNQRKNEQPS